MFIRKVTTRSSASGTSYSSYRLVRNVKTPSGRTRQLHLLNLGAQFDLPRDQWPALVQLILDLDANQLPLVPPDPDLLARAQRIYHCLLDRGAFPPGDDDLESVHLDSLDLSRVRSVGAERLALHALDQLQFQDALRAQGASARHARTAAALVLARMLRPSSERAACAWLNSRSATLELLGLERPQPLSLHKLYRTADLLWRHREALEVALCNRERTLFPTRSSLVFLDLTNAHYHGPAREDLQFGRSKQRRNDCPLVTLGLTLDESGFPLRSEVLPGNISEPSTLAGALRRLREPRLRAFAGPALPTVIMDAGLSTEKTVAWLQQEGYDWITVHRTPHRPPQRKPDAVFETRQGHEAQAWVLRAEDFQDGGQDGEQDGKAGAGAPSPPDPAENPEDQGQEDPEDQGEQDSETQLCVWTRGRQAKEDAILERNRRRFEQELRELDEGLSVKGRTKRYEKVLERVGRIKERYPKAAKQYRVTVVKGKKKDRMRLASAVRVAHSPQHEERTAQSGSYVLRTSHGEWDTERIVKTYWQLADIEKTFRSLQGETGLRPIFHCKAERIRGHLFLSVLAYHAIHLLRRRLQAQGIHDSWATIRNKLSRWMRVSTRLQAGDGSWIETRQDTRPDPEAAVIAAALGQPARLHRRRVRIPARKVGRASGPQFGGRSDAEETNR